MVYMTHILPDELEEMMLEKLAEQVSKQYETKPMHTCVSFVKLFFYLLLCMYFFLASERIYHRL